MILPAFEIQRPLDYEGPNRWRHSPALAVISILLSVRESIEGELMTRTKKVVITAFGDESKLAIVECDLNDPAAGEVQLSVEYTIVSGSDVATRHDILLYQESCSAKVFSRVDSRQSGSWHAVERVCLLGVKRIRASGNHRNWRFTNSLVRPLAR